ncbi:MAG: ribonuclease P protein component, partial [Rhodobacteraceae bacterium]|nr:ribonuclease P protein component [Paracoccaceae bacterium]
MVCETEASGPGRELPNDHPAARPRGGVSHLALEPLRKRSDFLLAARARREGRPGFLLQARPRNDTAPPRLGLTCSRKIGNAVARNRARRRLRAAARAVLPGRAL